MPLGIERINARRRQPNERIVFIKPLEGPNKELALDFLERIAAICNPIMKANHLSVMSLEEYEPNMEFVGRNFNAGEVIQLVLKAPYTGHWLPFRHVQMVMMHELAHCKQMNHSGAFWKVRNAYSGELRALWEKNYSGEGLWSRGQTLLSGQYTTSANPDTETMPRSLCGGTYRSSRRGKRKRKQKTSSSTLSYAEKKQRRIAKKFGTQGQALGDAEEERVKLEDGKRTKGKPKVAGSARGRDLRAAAALARLEKGHDEASANEESSSSSESEYEEVGIKQEAIDQQGNKLLDAKGRGLVQVCEGDDLKEDKDAQRELDELQAVDESYHGSQQKIKREDSYDKNPSFPSGVSYPGKADLQGSEAPLAKNVSPSSKTDKVPKINITPAKPKVIARPAEPSQDMQPATSIQCNLEMSE
ncbi:MAG: hypothetical protein M4579_001440 [Chaenotheca gracillima]|nr:MAG: hypothetical protein M4579_001440 [Chaenotheca gracillima]